MFLNTLPFKLFFFTWDCASRGNSPTLENRKFIQLNGNLTCSLHEKFNEKRVLEKQLSYGEDRRSSWPRSFGGGGHMLYPILPRLTFIPETAGSASLGSSLQLHSQCHECSTFQCDEQDIIHFLTSFSFWVPSQIQLWQWQASYPQGGGAYPMTRVTMLKSKLEKVHHSNTQ